MTNNSGEKSNRWWRKFKFLNCRKSCTAAQDEHLEDEKNISVSQKSGFTGCDANEYNNGPHKTKCSENEHSIKYGELVILGYNGVSTQPGEMNQSRFELFKRCESNGVDKSRQYVVQSPKTTKAIVDQQQHSVAYVLSKTKTVIEEYKKSEETDMFQVGRSTESTIDFSVPQPNGKVMKISRFACRILVDRKTHNAKIFAAGFDSKRNIFLGRKGLKWEDDAEIDGLTTNGALIMHPKGHFSGGNAECGVWRECSVGGNLFYLRKLRNAIEKTTKVQGETNELKDGTLIDLCGFTLLWRSAEGLESSPTDIQKNLVGLNVYLIPRQGENTRPYFYLKCGHIQLHRSESPDGQVISTDNRAELRCTVCFVTGPALKLSMGMEPAFYVDSGPPTFAFNPCGHITSEKTAKHWAKMEIPNSKLKKGHIFKATCPFCAEPLGSPKFINLKF